MPTLRTTCTLKITSPVPPSLSHETLLNTLHNHPFLLNIQPITTSYIPLPQDSPLIPSPEKEAFSRLPASDVDWYQVHETVPLVGSISFVAAFRDTDAGCECVVRAPMGLRMGVVYLVEHGEASNERKGEPMKTAEREETFLKEVCRIEANALLVPFITFNFESVHRKMQREMLEMLERGDMPRDKRAVEKT